MKKRIFQFLSLLTVVAMASPSYGTVVDPNLPSGAAVEGGALNAEISTVDKIMTVTQHAGDVIINYNTFNVGAGYTVDFKQPSATSTALNRVTGGNMSEIYGTITANGRIFLVNPNGILFGSGCNVDTAGLVASTIDISDVNFNGKNYIFDNGAGAGNVVNQGKLNAPGGYVALLSRAVENTGTIQAQSIALVSGDAMTLSLDPLGLISVTVDSLSTAPAGKDDAVANSGTLKAEKIVLSAKVINGIFDNAINNSGVIEATGVAGNGGMVQLVAEGGDIVAGGGISAAGEGDMLSDFIQEKFGTVYPSLISLAPDSYKGRVSVKALDGDITLGLLGADLIDVDVAAGKNGGGNILDAAGDVMGKFVSLEADGNIGSEINPITTLTEKLAVYSVTQGDVFVTEGDELEVGVFFPLEIIDSYGDKYYPGLLMGAASNDGTVNIKSEGDMTVNYAIAPRGGIYLKSEKGSIFAGQGFTRGFSIFNSKLAQWMDVSAIAEWVAGWGAKMYANLFTQDFSRADCNLVAGSYSYISSPTGTIGVGTAASKDPAMSAGIYGIISDGVTSINGIDPSPDFDPIYGMPSGLVAFSDKDKGGTATAGFVQVYPLNAGTVSFSNPLSVETRLVTTTNGAVPAWFVPAGSLTLQFGVPQPPVPAGDSGAGLMRFSDLSLYYEIMDGYQFNSIEPSTPINFYAYHPIIKTDQKAFDEVSLDLDAYDFIEGRINLKKKNPYLDVQ